MFSGLYMDSRGPLKRNNDALGVDISPIGKAVNSRA